jgi:hypothetical protein
LIGERDVLRPPRYCDRGEPLWLDLDEGPAYALVHVPATTERHITGVLIVPAFA